MKITNHSGKIIGVGELPLLPGETAELPAGYENNPVILGLIEAGKLIKATEPAAPGVEPPPTPSPRGDGTPSPEDDKKDRTPGGKAGK